MDSIPSQLSLPIQTPRLMLRLLQPDDAVVVLDYKRESWLDFEKWMIWTHPPAPPARTLADEQGFCRYMCESIARRERLVFLAFDRSGSRLIGHGGLNKIDWKIPMCILGYGVRSSETRKGYATEIALALAHYALEVLGMRKVATFHADGNIGSQRVIEKVGFEKEGVLRQQHELPGGIIVDEHHYGLLRGCKSGFPLSRE